MSGDANQNPVMRVHRLLCSAFITDEEFRAALGSHRADLTTIGRYLSLAPNERPNFTPYFDRAFYLVSNPDVAEAVVFGVPDNKWGETPLAAVQLRKAADGVKVSADDLRIWINDRVAARYQRVSAVRIVENFPRNAAGKILKRELRDPYWAASERQI